VKGTFFIVGFLVITLSYSCNKTSIDTSTVSNQIVDSAQMYYDTLLFFTKQGNAWQCTRYDNITALPFFNVSFYNTYSTNWEPLLPLQISNQTHDTTIEKYLVADHITLGKIRKIFNDLSILNKNSHSPNTSYSYDVVTSVGLNFLNNYNISDTALCSIITITNLNRNLVDTEFVYLSKQFFAIFPGPKFIPNTASSFYIKDWSIPDYFFLLSVSGGYKNSYNIPSNISYTGDIAFSSSYGIRSGNGAESDSKTTALVISQQKGIIYNEIDTIHTEIGASFYGFTKRIQ